MVGGKRAMVLREQHGEEDARSVWPIIDAEVSIGLLRIIISISCQVARAINPILGEPSSRRWSNKTKSMKHHFGLQKGQEEPGKVNIPRCYAP